MRRKTPLFIYLISLLICIFFSNFIQAKVQSDTFKVTVKGRSIEVVSPQNFSEKLSVIVVNESLTKIVFKAMKDTGKSLGFLILEPKSFASLNLTFEESNVEYYLIPYSPSSQKIILKIGREVYDIPYQK
ncbi:MAG: hypothetical protein VXY34_07095 [Bdellovibrionota bacterium]|nr:hypothetical protein [Bdellovibrionota bacterium]